VSELAVDGILVAVTCRVLKLARQPYYRWLAAPVGARELEAAHLANVLFDAHRDDPEFGHRMLADEAARAGLVACDRTVADLLGQRLVVGVRQEARPGRQEGRPAGARRPRAAPVPRRRTQPAMAVGHHRAPDERGQDVSLRDQGRVLQPDRRVLDQ